MPDIAALVSYLGGNPDDVGDLEGILDALLGTRPKWHRKARCRGFGTDAFYPGTGDSTDAAKAVCARCTVREECVADALSRPDAPGIWGGTSARERRVLRRELPAPEPIVCRHCRRPVAEVGWEGHCGRCSRHLRAYGTLPRRASA